MSPESLPESLADRASLSSGLNFWQTKAVGDIPSVIMTDGPHGLRKLAELDADFGAGESVAATCFPPAVALGQTWDPALAERVGQALGDECQAEDVQILLGPGINIKRSPLGGRNFEYFSEDPLISGVMGSAWIRGIQSRGVGASLKHFALNNQEDDRMRASSDVDPRPLREIYLRAFRRAVTESQPWTVMCSYNRVNGVLASENRFLLTEVLRGEWNFEGVVVSDWGAVRDRPAALAAGLDLQMPADGGMGDADAVEAVAAGTLDEAFVDRAAERVAALARKGREQHREGVAFDADTHHALAREVAGRSIVLLQNEGDLLPLAASAKLAVIGEFARTPRYQGGGSSHVNPTRVDIPLDSLKLVASDVTFAAGFTIDGSGESEALVAEAIAAAKAADVAILFLGLDASQESEGFDRTDIDLPVEQLNVMAAVAHAQPNTVVVLSHGGVLRLADVAATVPAILDGALLGQAVGSAIADVLFGAVNPSGRVTETVPVRLADTPAFLNFPGEHQHVRYGEGLFVGYRWYDARGIEVTFPFGHGLSYTTFEYGAVSVTADGDSILATVPVTNTGTRAGREVVQAYVSMPQSQQVRVPWSLGGFASVLLAPGETQPVTIRIERTEFEYWDVRLDRFIVEPGQYGVAVGTSSREMASSAWVELAGEVVKFPLTPESTMGEVMANPVAAQLIGSALASMMPAAGANDSMGVDFAKMMASIPIERVIGFAGGAVTREQLGQLLAAANAG